MCLCIDKIQPDKREPVVPSCSAADCHQWRCKKCTYVNADADFHCIQCGNPSWPNSEVEVPVETGWVRGQRALPRDDTDGPQPAQYWFQLGRLKFLTRQATSNEQWSPEDCAMPTWRCDHCTAENYAWNEKCGLCYTAHYSATK